MKSNFDLSRRAMLRASMKYAVGGVALAAGGVALAQNGGGGGGGGGSPNPQMCYGSFGGNGAIPYGVLCTTYYNQYPGGYTPPPVTTISPKLQTQAKALAAANDMATKWYQQYQQYLYLAGLVGNPRAMYQFPQQSFSVCQFPAGTHVTNASALVDSWNGQEFCFGDAEGNPVSEAEIQPITDLFNEAAANLADAIQGNIIAAQQQVGGLTQALACYSQQSPLSTIFGGVMWGAVTAQLAAVQTAAYVGMVSSMIAAGWLTVGILGAGLAVGLGFQALAGEGDVRCPTANPFSVY